MDYQEFLREVVKNVRIKVQGGRRVAVNTIIKNNDLKYDAITIYKDNQNIIPSVYVNHYYEEYLKGKPLDEIVDDIISIHESCGYPKLLDEDICNFMNVTKLIFYRLVNQKMNEQRLQGIPSKMICDLAKVYQVLVHMDEEGVSSFTITNEMMDKWNVDVDTIDSYARENTQTLFPVTLKCMSDIIREMIYGADKGATEEYIEEDGVTKMYVLSNKFGINGASAILYKDVLKNFALQVNSNLYILPSSTHEVIIVPAIGKISISNLKAMVTDVNQHEVAVEDVLSNEVYFYDYELDNLSIAED